VLARVAREGPGLAEAIRDPFTNALACASATPRFHESPAARAQREALVARTMHEGLHALDRRERGRLLNDPLALSRLHFEAWAAPGAQPAWLDAKAPAGTSR
jgi:membrane glycosyltransferase